jgi:aminopeptidase YwaD
VVGVLLNPADTAAEARGVASDFNDWANLDYTTGSDVIGHDWKTFDMGTFTYLMEDSLYYFVKAQNGNIYKISFTSFSGSATGTTTFTQQLVSSLSVPENSSQPTTIYPNPAREQINIVTPAGQKGTVIISNLTGQELSRVSFTNGNSHAINISGLINGTYIVSVKTDNTFYSKKIVIVND